MASSLAEPVEKCAGRGTWERAAPTRKVIAPVWLTARVSLGSLCSLWLSCSVLSSEQNWSAKVKQLDKSAHSGLCPVDQSEGRDCIYSVPP